GPDISLQSCSCVLPRCCLSLSLLPDLLADTAGVLCLARLTQPNGHESRRVLGLGASCEPRRIATPTGPVPPDQPARLLHRKYTSECAYGEPSESRGQESGGPAPLRRQGGAASAWVGTNSG